MELDRVSFSYDGATNALEDVSAVCRPGEVTAIVGPSGAGKTTLASLLPRFYDVSDGGRAHGRGLSPVYVAPAIGDAARG